MYAICLKEDGRHIGNLKIGPIEWKHGTSDLVTVIGDREQWGKGFATEAIKLGNKIAFEKYNIRKLSGGMYASNVPSIKAYTNAGWIIEGRLFNHYVHSGKFEDRVIVSASTLALNNKIILGTVQFGMNYGVSNSAGKPEKEEVFQIFEQAAKAGVENLDTADTYGNASELIGDFLEILLQDLKLTPNLKLKKINLLKIKSAVLLIS